MTLTKTNVFPEIAAVINTFNFESISAERKIILQPLVENAFFHGILCNTDEEGEVMDGCITIRIRMEEDEVDDEEYFKIYKDKSEEFKCNIQVEGSSIENTEARLIIESENWKLVFDGEIVNGKCIIPIKKLNILNENEIGNIKLEVITEGSIFVPWEDKFKVHVSKKVIFSLDESLKNKKTNNPNNKKDNKIGVKVNFK